MPIVRPLGLLLSHHSVRFPIVSIRHPQPATRNPQPATRNPQLATRNSPLATRHSSLMQYHLFDTTTRWQRMSVLIELGGAALDEFKDSAATPEFQPWFVAVKEMATIKQVNLAQADAEWLWDVLRSEPSVQAEFGDLSAAGTPWFHQTEHFHVLNQGERFAIGLKPSNKSAAKSRGTIGKCHHRGSSERV